jgi:hypothetical protein
MISFKQRGSFENLERFFANIFKSETERILDSYGEQGIEALSAATPKDTGLTAASYSYRVSRTAKGYRIEWDNSNADVSGTPIAILLEYGHATSSGTYVEGRDFINPALRPIFDQIAENLWKEVTN